MVSLTGLVNSGVVTLEDLLDGGGGTPSPAPAPKSVEKVLAAVRAKCKDFFRPLERDPLFQVGDEVVTQRHVVPVHTRLPAYVRGRRRRITVYHGAHLMPDAVWRGVEAAAPLYTVRFEARELWRPDAAEDYTVMLDLWESYLPAA